MPNKIGHEAHYNDAKHSVNVKLSLIEFEEDGLFFVYSPALDLTGYGKTHEEARDSYNVAMEEFIKYTTNKKTIAEVLANLGWNVSKKKRISAPSLSELLQSRVYLEEIFTEKQFRKTDEEVNIPSFA
jgi:predicted RNase H-like HicB family nuclease